MYLHMTCKLALHGQAEGQLLGQPKRACCAGTCKQTAADEAREVPHHCRQLRSHCLTAKSAQA